MFGLAGMREETFVALASAVLSSVVSVVSHSSWVFCPESSINLAWQVGMVFYSSLVYAYVDGCNSFGFQEIICVFTRRVPQNLNYLTCKKLAPLKFRIRAHTIVKSSVTCDLIVKVTSIGTCIHNVSVPVTCKVRLICWWMRVDWYSQVPASILTDVMTFMRSKNRGQRPLMTSYHLSQVLPLLWYLDSLISR